MAKKTTTDQVLEFIDKNKGLFFVVGNPIHDELIVGFNGEVSRVKFPITLDKSQNVMVRMLSKSQFAPGMSDFLSGLMKGIQADTEDESTKVVANAIGGAVQEMVGLNSDNENKNG